MADAIRSLPRSMFAEKTPQSLARALVAQAAYTTVRDPSAPARLKFTAVTTLAKMLQSFDQTRSRPDALSSRAPLAELDRSGTLAQVPLDVLLASVSTPPRT